MKKLLTLSLLAISASGYAAQCRVDINNEVRMDGQNLEIVHTNGEKAVVDGDNNLFIKGERIDLDDDQKAAIENYREKMNAYIPQAKQLAISSGARPRVLLLRDGGSDFRDGL